jgi:hypothetical protein
MLPNLPPNVTPTDDAPNAAQNTAPATATPTVPSNPPEVAAAPGPAMPPDGNPHVDYNLHPLKVASLEHYLEQPTGGERFRVS